MMQIDSRFFTLLLHERVEQPIAPRPRGLGEIRLDALHVDLGNASGTGANDEQPARERRVRHVVVDLRLASVERLFENRARLLLELRRVAVAGHEDVAGDESLEDVSAREERDAMALLKLQDAPRDLKEIVVGDLKDFVARKGLEDVDERLSVMRMRIESGTLDDAPRLEAQHRNLANAAAVRRRREEAEEAVLADQIAVLVVTLDADAIHRHGAMHDAGAVRFGDDQQVLAPRVLAELRCERVLRSLHRFRPHAAKDAEAALRIGGEKVVVVMRLESVAAIAEEDEVAVVEPLQELARFFDLLFGHRQIGVIELRGERRELGAHRFEVGDREPDVGEDPLER